jgi:hypothetical protein
VTPTAESPSMPKSATNIAHNVPFPALSSNGAAHPSVPANSGLSYSRVTHTPTTPGFPADSSYFPYTEPNGHGQDAKPHPFRYSREQILGLWDEEKVRETPIELVDLGDGGILVSKAVVRPIGLRDLTEQERKVCRFLPRFVQSLTAAPDHLGSPTQPYPATKPRHCYRPSSVRIAHVSQNHRHHSRKGGPHPQSRKCIRSLRRSGRCLWNRENWHHRRWYAVTRSWTRRRQNARRSRWRFRWRRQEDHAEDGEWRRW